MRTLYDLTMETHDRYLRTHKEIENDDGEGQVSWGGLELTDQEAEAFNMALHSLWEVTAHLFNDGTDGQDTEPEAGRIGKLLEQIVADFNEDVAGWTSDKSRAERKRIQEGAPQRPQ